MRIRPGRTRSLIAGIGALIIMLAGLFMMPGAGTLSPMPGMGRAFGVFRILWILVGLVGAGAAFYNAFSAKGVALYEIDTDDDVDGQSQGETYCPKCGTRVGRDDSYCRKCGAVLR